MLPLGTSQPPGDKHVSLDPTLSGHRNVTVLIKILHALHRPLVFLCQHGTQFQVVLLVTNG